MSPCTRWDVSRRLPFISYCFALFENPDWPGVYVIFKNNFNENVTLPNYLGVSLPVTPVFYGIENNVLIFFFPDSLDTWIAALESGLLPWQATPKAFSYWGVTLPPKSLVIGLLPPDYSNFSALKCYQCLLFVQDDEECLKSLTDGFTVNKYPAPSQWPLESSHVTMT